MGLSTALAALRKAITDAVNGAGITPKGQIILGWPTAPQLVEVFAQPDKEWQISIYPLPARNTTRYISEPSSYSLPVVNLVGTVAGNTLTFSGSVPVQDGALNVHAFIRGVNADILLQVSPGTANAAIATALAAAVNAAAIPGVTATPTGNGVALTGALWKSVNVGGTGKVVTGEMTRVRRGVQVTIWTTGDPEAADVDEPLRLAIYDAIIERVGTTSNHFLTASDGTRVFCLYQNDSFDDDSQSSYTLYAARIIFDFEYGVLLPFAATQIGVAEPTTTVVAGDLTLAHTDFIGE